MITKVVSPDDQNPLMGVIFVVPGSIWVDSICLVGDFNHWSHHAHPLQRNAAGDWEIALMLPRGARYQFRYLCDGSAWMMEHQADGYALGADRAGYACVLSTELDRPSEPAAILDWQPRAEA